MQSLSEKNLKQAPKGVFRTLCHMLKQEGLTSPYRGFSITVLGSGPSHGVYFAAYELSKDFLAQYSNSSIIYGISGMVATLAHDTVMIPTETVKQRMQVADSPYKSFKDCIVTVYKKEGIRAFYRSYGTQLLMNIPFQSVQFTTYEICNKFLNPNLAYNPLIHVISGALAGAAAAAVTTPLDVCKTLLNTQQHKDKVVGLKNAVTTVYNLAGPLGYFRGTSARVLFVMPSTAICWGTYETVKFLLKKS
ncbi:mitoferrin-like [Lycorma delicatula]|uniref:mitoferrin-like n=1 Tax=Lycorma delicatula TaxID=130591 RepID=UPI003F513BD2